MRNAALHAERLHDALVEIAQGDGIGGIVWERARAKNVAAGHHGEWRFGIAAGDGKDYLIFPDDRIHMKDAAGDELFEHEIRLPVAKFVQLAPQLFGGIEFLDAE